MHCVFTCSKCGYEISWDNAKEYAPTCPKCSPPLSPSAQADLAISRGNVADWWQKTQAAWRTGELRSATRCLLEILRLDPDLDQIAWKNLLMPNRVDMSGVPERLLTEVSAIVKSMGPRAVDSPQARQTRLRLVSEIMSYVQPDTSRP